MKKRAILQLIILNLLLLLTINNVAAVVYLSELDDAYNLGDMINLEVSISPIEKGPISIKLVCDNKESLISYTSNPTENFSVQLPLTSVHINDLTGDCYFSANYNSVDYKSLVFKISKKLDVSLSPDSFFIKPGEDLIVKGSAKRLNGAGANGVVEITIPNLGAVSVENNQNDTGNLTNDTNNVNSGDIFYGNIQNGEFSVIVNIRKDTPAGEYRIEVFAYEKDEEDQKISEGIARGNLIVAQVLTDIDIAIDGQNINPGIVFGFRPILLDQTGKNIDDEASVIILDAHNNRVFEGIFKSDSSGQYNLPTNVSAGYYTIRANNGNTTKEKTFYINEKAMVSFEFVNETLIVTNIGNVRYDKDIQVELNGKPFVKKVSLGLGESTKFKLTGANEEYSIKVSDGESEITRTGVTLTGNVVGVEEDKGSGIKRFGIVNSPIMWIFFIIILAGILLFFLRNKLKKRSFAYPSMPERKSSGSIVEGPRKITVIPRTESKKEDNKTPTSVVSISGPIRAEQASVVQGDKHKVAVIAIKVKNELGTLLQHRLDKAVEAAYVRRGAVYKQRNDVIIIFSPLLTNSLKNELTAAAVAKKIMENINYMNRKFKDKIEYGISISSGEVINKVENKKLIFTPLRSLIPAAKSLADLAKEEVLMSKEAFESSSTDLKSERKRIGDRDVYVLKGVVDHEKNKKFIDDFVKRNKV